MSPNTKAVYIEATFRGWNEDTSASYKLRTRQEDPGRWDGSHLEWIGQEELELPTLFEVGVDDDRMIKWVRSIYKNAHAIEVLIKEWRTQ